MPHSSEDKKRAITRLRRIKGQADALERAIEAGADVLDIGGESTRPNAQPVSSQQEMDRVLPVVEADGPLEHRDRYLTAEERGEGRSMCICVSRIRGRHLVLDA